MFVDTGAWYALIDRKDPDHKAAVDFLSGNKVPLVTSNFVFDETVTLLNSRLGWSIASAFGKKLKDSGFVSLAAIKDADEEKAWEIFLKFKDNDFSYTDCTSFSLMQRLGIAEAFSFDGHFKAMKFQVFPAV